ncbi:MAG: abrB 2 [Paenibacillus sp.]|jgi:transcriptional pleiotropic regulator of transition state genes|nr:abrB 2 [Paenibacillus sp.]
MKATGIVRKIDELGRIVIPMELRRTMNISEKDPLEIFVDGEQIILRKYSPGCISCGSTKQLKPLPSGRYLCHDCLASAIGSKSL